MTGTGRKQAFWDAQSTIHCPICQKPYKARSPFFSHLQYFHELGYQGALVKAKEYYASLLIPRSDEQPKDKDTIAKTRNCLKDLFDEQPKENTTP